ncbi:MAG TPA: orotate phosphoribosyltransferase [Thermomicrobiales bacterium]|nr:orotate phosphoribosyltransferase [Thermomicrobiales bacterium]
MRGQAFLSELESIGALKTGHFLLASGRHSDRYIEKFDLLRNPRATERACRAMIDMLGGQAFDLVVGPTTGGILLAFEIGRQLGLPAAYAERAVDGASARAFKRGTAIKAGARVLLVDDILTTGGSIRETLAALGDWRADVRVVSVLVDRSGGSVEFGVPLVALASLQIDTHDQSTCPLCAVGLPIEKPGSTVAPTAR